MTRKSNAFSLVELSIVLVILGLLVGGVLAGKSLIRAAELRSVTTEHQKYSTAINAFRQKYFALPGDMTNATQFWGAADPTPATCNATIKLITDNSTATCNGDGNGKIDAVNSAINSESYRAWQHLSGSGLIPSANYSGWSDGEICGGPINSSYPTGCPVARIGPGYSGKVYWQAVYIEQSNYVTYKMRFSVDYGHSIILGGGGFSDLVMTPIEVRSIDAKIDDGKPVTGKIIATGLSRTTCTTAASVTDLTGDYKLTTTTKYCSLVFRQQF